MSPRPDEDEAEVEVEHLRSEPPSPRTGPGWTDVLPPAVVPPGEPGDEEPGVELADVLGAGAPRALLEAGLVARRETELLPPAEVPTDEPAGDEAPGVGLRDGLGAGAQRASAQREGELTARPGPGGTEILPPAVVGDSPRTDSPAAEVGADTWADDGAPGASGADEDRSLAPKADLAAELSARSRTGLLVDGGSTFAAGIQAELAGELADALGGVELEDKAHSLVDETQELSGAPGTARVSARPRLGPGVLIAGRFRVEGHLGGGAMGLVLSAREDQTGRRVAIKVPLVALRERQFARFQREAQVTARLRHPHVVRVHAFGQHEGWPYVVYGLVEGSRSLGDVRPTLELDQHLHLLEQIGEGVGAAHREGVVHRDLKPENVLVTPEGEAVVADFGIAWVDGPERLTRTGEAIGTPRYMAPEQVKAERGAVSAQTDVWALGVLLYEALYDEHPFGGASMAELLAAIHLGTPPFPRVAGRGAVVALARQCLSKDASQRPRDGAAFALALRRARGAAAATRPPHVWVSGLVGLVVAVLLATALLWPRPQTTTPAGGAESTPLATPTRSPGSSPPPAHGTPSPTPPADGPPSGVISVRVPGARRLRLLRDGRLLVEHTGRERLALKAFDAQGKLLVQLPDHELPLPQKPADAILFRQRRIERLDTRGVVLWRTPQARTLAYTPDGDVIVWVDQDDRTWLRTKEGERRPVPVRFVPRVIVATPTAVLFGAETGAEIYSLPALVRTSIGPQSPSVLEFALDPSGRYVATGGRHGMVAIIDLQFGRLEFLTRKHPYAGGLAGLAAAAHVGRVRGLAWSDDGKRLVTVGQSSEFAEGVAIWNAETRKIQATGLSRQKGYEAVDVLGERVVLLTETNQVILTTFEHITATPKLYE